MVDRSGKRVSERLADLRARNDQVIAALRQQEKNIDEALAGWAVIADRIDAERDQCATKVAVLLTEIDKAKEASEEKVSAFEEDQSRILRKLLANGRSITEISAILGIQRKTVKQLLREDTPPAVDVVNGSSD